MRNRKYESPYGKPANVTDGDRVGMLTVNLSKAAGLVKNLRPFHAAECSGVWMRVERPTDIRGMASVYGLDHPDMRTGERNYIVLTGVADAAIPLFVYDTIAQRWFENSDTIYRGTSQQRKRLRPVPHCETVKQVTEIINGTAMFGFGAVAKLQLQRDTKRDWRERLRAYIASHSGGHSWTLRAASQAYEAQMIEQRRRAAQEWRQHYIKNYKDVDFSKLEYRMLQLFNLPREGDE